ncbi:MAG: GxxExxY protein [Candidatus Zixiibacteriota bacterium]|nr:MAG: GxxExxY protein [candidate division Zixibacteria bacterium]
MKDSELVIDTKTVINDLQSQVINSALEVHKNMGLGFGKKEYSRALAHEFGLRDIPFESHKNIKLSYKGSVAGEYNLDFVVDKSLVVLISTDDHLTDIVESKLRSILKSIRLKKGLIVNFSKNILEIKTIKR